MVTRKARWLAPLLAIVASAGLVAATGAPAMASGGQTLQQSAANIVGTGLPGAWGVDTNGQTAAAGVANRDTLQVPQPAMKGRVGSVTKEFVAAATLIEVAAGCLSLDDTVQDWVPNLLPYGGYVTVKQLMNHTSGIPDYLESGNNPLLNQFINSQFATIGGQPNPGYDLSFKYHTWTPQDLIARISGEPRHVLPPNQAEYSDSNYIVLGLVLQAATGQSVQSLVQSLVLNPLGLSNTSFPISSITLASPFGRGYSVAIDDATGLPVPGVIKDFTEYNTSFLWATGAVVSNAADLNKFQKAFVGNAIPGHTLPSWLVTAMKATVPITLPDGLFPPGFGAGLGIWSWNLKASLDYLGVPNTCGSTTLWGHEGEVPGYDTWSFTNPAATRAASLFVNQMVPSNWDSQYYAKKGELPQYALHWC